MSEFRPGRIGLQFKLVAALLVVASVPLVASALLIPQIAQLAQNFASQESAMLRPPLVKAQEAYRDLVDARQRAYQQQGARIAATLRFAPLWAEPLDKEALDVALAEFLDEPDLQELRVLDPSGREITSAIDTTLRGEAERWAGFSVTADLPGERKLVMQFTSRADFLNDFQELMTVLRLQDVDAVRSSLPEAYRTAFLLIVGGIVLVVTAAGILLARRMTRRMETLAQATRDVASGDLGVRVNMKGRDELAELSHRFNRMVAQLEHDRRQIAYLQKMSAWQDVARRLAHEIKNPLTPIQLAVQQCVSSYRGDDPKYARTLADAAEIVGEEISGLRRLVDAFRTLGRLPQAQLAPTDLAAVATDLQRDPSMQGELVVREPPNPVLVRGDRLLLRRLLANLVENGMHAGKEAGKEGRVELAWGKEDDGVSVTVDDEGAGVPPEAREQIFEPYFTGKEHGTGLGLAIAKKIALDHGGSLDLSPEPGALGGARFVLRLVSGDGEGPAVRL